ncbi:hypothetical protein [Actinophytocola xanthii]|uniref:YtxH domain-containing protein n=1 Tax=Actinophytocola xanthii TaxID=1912961 RepID=A0A1Q8CWM1_9PSEU|nr:hypothetical protein [Actinophytocola xanthii]OLF18748.1 hypothetical protein BU204_04390 [Actinophytocola xanthii]
MKAFVLGAAVGYVLGAKAGRGRYDQIVRTYRKVADHPAVQGAAGVARAKVGEKVGLGGRSKSATAQNTNGRRNVSEPAYHQP